VKHSWVSSYVTSPRGQALAQHGCPSGAKLSLRYACESLSTETRDGPLRE